MSVIPVFLPAKSRKFLPGILVADNPFTVVTSAVPDGDSIKTGHLEISRGLPRVLSADEALLRLMIGVRGMKSVYEAFPGYSGQRAALLKILSGLGWDGRSSWFRYDLFGLKPLLGLRRENGRTVLLTDLEIPDPFRGASADAHVLSVPDEFLEEVPADTALRYSVSSPELLKDLSGDLPDSEIDSALEEIWSRIESEYSERS